MSHVAFTHEMRYWFETWGNWIKDNKEGLSRPKYRYSKICHGNADCLIKYFITNFFCFPKCALHSHFQFYFIIFFPISFQFLLNFNFKCGPKKFRSEDWLGHVAHLGHGLKGANVNQVQILYHFLWHFIIIFTEGWLCV